MSFFLTLPSDSNRQEYSNNTSNSYKVRLPDPLRLDGEWEVGLSAVSLPDAAPQMKSLVKFKGNHFLKTGWRSVDGSGNEKTRQKFFKLDQFNRAKPKDGVELCKMFISFCNNTKSHTALDHTYRKSRVWEKNGKKLYIDIKMEGEDLLLDNSKVDTSSKDVYLDFDEGFAAAMKWIEYDENGKALLGPNVQIVLDKTTDLDDGSVVEDVQIDGTTTAVYWTVKQGWFMLSKNASWRFVNINQAFRDITDYSARSLFVYSNVGQSQVVGNKVTDLLREVPYETKGAGMQYIEPVHVQYKKVRNNVLDIIEVQVSETDGRLTTFREGTTTLTLHFRKLA